MKQTSWSHFTLALMFNLFVSFSLILKCLYTYSQYSSSIAGLVCYNIVFDDNKLPYLLNITHIKSLKQEEVYYSIHSILTRLLQNQKKKITLRI